MEKKFIPSDAAGDAPLESEYPVSEYYRKHVLAAETISHTGPWWTAILLIEDPNTKKPFIGLYRWQKTAAGWKTRKRFTFNNRDLTRKGLLVIEKFAGKLE